MSIRTTNRGSGACARALEPFRNSSGSLHGNWVEYPKRYAVWSYGEHFPLYMWEKGIWYENKDKYSQTTTRHLQYARPSYDTIKLDTETMKQFVRFGVNKATFIRLTT